LFELHKEKMEDYWEVEALFDLCFSPGRFALSSYRLREGYSPIKDLCLIAKSEENLIGGAIRYWPAEIDKKRILLLGPIAVHPTYQGEGIGAALIKNTIKRARELNWKRVLMVGDEMYYRKFGFRKIDGIIFPPPTNPNRILGIELEEFSWQGVQGKILPIKIEN
tara:strand:+ start:427 stop:921 length:495 start_codon:yes stop_codon:yes gene_type:complete